MVIRNGTIRMVNPVIVGQNRPPRIDPRHFRDDRDGQIFAHPGIRVSLADIARAAFVPRYLSASAR